MPRNHLLPISRPAKGSDGPIPVRANARDAHDAGHSVVDAQWPHPIPQHCRSTFADGLTADLTFRSRKTLRAVDAPAVLKKKEEEAARPPEPPRVASLAATLATITDGYSIAAHTRFDVLHGKADSFTIAVPKGANVLEAAGRGRLTVTE